MRDMQDGCGCFPLDWPVFSATFAHITYNRPEAGRTIAVVFRQRGKSGLHRAGCQVTPGRRKPTESAAENIPPMAFGHRQG
ncbi:hypothetical protein DFR30_0760 [Thiogranum longum]|uniref:Uncharacterized protein n=1 Tax=Thiogranum longum TaxID=1537524 RepID=A0A4R1H8G0_9GAMM|nr:hypothetical protein DFR30_0760 [Thiogranum longum]